jgi:hypothetical protein
MTSATITPSARHDAGVRAMSCLLNYWLTHSRLSFEQLISIANWGLGESGMLDKAVLSRLKSGLKARSASYRQIDALSAANRAIWLWQVRGPERAVGLLGPHSSWGVRTEWLDQAKWLPHPDHPTEPLEFADFAEVVSGHLELPYLGPTPLTLPESREASARLAQVLDGICSERGWGPLGVAKLLKAYPVGDSNRIHKLRRVLLGEHQYSPDELESELLALAEMIRQVRDLEAGTYGPAELQAELLNR